MTTLVERAEEAIANCRREIGRDQLHCPRWQINYSFNPQRWMPSILEKLVSALALDLVMAAWPLTCDDIAVTRGVDALADIIISADITKVSSKSRPGAFNNF